MKHKLTPTQLLCLIASAIITAIGCHNQTKQAAKPVDTTKVDTASFITEHPEIPKQ